MSTAENAAQVFAALGDPTRLSLLAKLTGGEAQSIARLSDGAAMSRQAVTKHLTVLQGAGLVSRLRRGRESRYAYRPEPLDAARAYLDAVSAQWDAASDRLQDFLDASALSHGEREGPVREAEGRVRGSGLSGSPPHGRGGRSRVRGL